MTTTRPYITRYLLLLTLACFGAESASADDNKPASPFVGEWCNQDFTTGGITRVHVRQEGAKLVAQMWGRCHPTECDWGETTATVEEQGNVLSLSWTKNFKTVIQKLKLLKDGSLELVGHTQFTDKSGRADFDSKHTFAKGWIFDWNDPPPREEWENSFIL